MDLDLKAFSLTIGVGLALAGVMWGTIWVTDPWRAFAIVKRYSDRDNQPGVLANVMLGILLLGIGLACEALSKNAINSQGPNALAPQMSALLPSEVNSRCETIIDGRTEKEIKDGEPRRTCTDKRNYMGPVTLTPPGMAVMSLLTKINVAGIATPEEKRVYQLLGKTLTVSSCDRGPPDLDHCVRFEEQGQDATANDPSGAVQQLYYLAKNTDYLNPTFFRELEDFRVRYDFERSIAFDLLLGVFILSFGYLANSTRDMWRDVGGWKTAISVMLAAVIVIALLDVLVAPRFAHPVWLTRQCERHLNLLLGKEIGENMCMKSGVVARAWVLPFALLFVCLYRLRRFFRRVGPWIAKSVVSAIQGPRLVQTDREAAACRALIIAAVLVAALFPTYAAYQSDQNNYLNRVFSYYVTVRGAALTCPSLDKEPCKKREDTHIVQTSPNGTSAISP